MILLPFGFYRRFTNFLTSNKKSTLISRLGRYSTSSTIPTLRVLFLGSDEFSIGSLKVLKELFHLDSLTVVVSHPNNSVAKFSKRHSLKVVSWDNLKTETSADKGDQFDVGVVASFGFLIPKKIIERCRMGILNVHGSILPRWRGASPISHAIMNGDRVTGVSIMQIAPHKFDIGPILLQREVPLHPHIRAPELKTILTEVGADALKEVLKNLDLYLSKVKSQNLLEGTLAPKVDAEMSQIHWDTQNALAIYNQYRGLCGFFKLKTNYQNRSVDLDDFAIHRCETKIKPSELKHSKLIEPNTDFSTFYSPPVTVNPFILPNKKDIKPGEIYFSNNYLCVKCFSEKCDSVILNWIFIRKIKVGVKWMSAVDFRNGFLSKSENNKFYSDNIQIRQNNSA